MRAAIDARPALDPRKTGVGHYAWHLARKLPAVDPESSYTAWYLHARGVLRPRRFFSDVEAPNFREMGSPFPARLFGPASTRLGIPRLEWFLDFDAVLATNFLPPATRSRGVVMTVHDLAFRIFPATAPQIDRRWSRRFRRWLGESARIIVPSESAKHDLVELENASPEKIDVVYHGVDAADFRPASAGAIEGFRRRFRIRDRYVLFVGGIEPRKNLVTLVRAFAKLSPEATLVIAGGPVRWFPSAARQLRAYVDTLPTHLRPSVVLAGYVSDELRAALLSQATAVCYPSLYEGFGFPVVEAMACGTPVLTSNVSSLPEVAGDAAILVDPNDADAIADGMGRLLSDEGLRSRLREAGLARAVRFSWDETARRTAEVLRRAASGA